MFETKCWPTFSTRVILSPGVPSALTSPYPTRAGDPGLVSSRDRRSTTGRPSAGSASTTAWLLTMAILSSIFAIPPGEKTGMIPTPPSARMGRKSGGFEAVGRLRRSGLRLGLARVDPQEPVGPPAEGEDGRRDFLIALADRRPEGGGVSPAEGGGAELGGGAMAEEEVGGALAVEARHHGRLAGRVEHAGEDQVLAQRIAQAADEIEEAALREAGEGVGGLRVRGEEAQRRGDRRRLAGREAQRAHPGVETDQAGIGARPRQLCHEEGGEEEQGHRQGAPE